MHLIFNFLHFSHAWGFRLRIGTEVVFGIADSESCLVLI